MGRRSPFPLTRRYLDGHLQHDPRSAKGMVSAVRNPGHRQGWIVVRRIDSDANRPDARNENAGVEIGAIDKSSPLPTSTF